MNILQIAATAIITAVLAVLVKQYKPEYAALVQLAGAVLIVGAAFRLIPELTGTAESMLSFAGIEGEWMKVLVKALGIAILSELAADVCRDNGSAALAGIVELAGKAAILLLALPLLRAVAEVAAGLIQSNN